MTMPGINHEKIRQQRERRGGGAGWKCKDGPNRIRVLPPHSRHIDNWDTLENIAIPYKMHFFKRQGLPTETSRCLIEDHKRCPACEMWRTYGKAPDPALAELAKQVAPADQYLMNILDLSPAGLAAGIQPWAANYTCWDKIMEIAANPMWGNVVDPANGINFEVTLIPSNRSGTGWNKYSVTPEREATTVMEILENLKTPWREALDALEEQKAPFKTADEIRSYLDEMGFPPSGGVAALARPIAATAGTGAVAPVGGGVRVAAPTATVGIAPTPAAAPRPVAPAAPAPAAAVRPVAAAPTPVAAAASAPAAAAYPAQPTAHYDPGEEYQPVNPPEAIPAGAPRCFGDFDPRRHQCRPCPVQSDCQANLLESDRAF